MQARQRLAWAEAHHPRLGADAPCAVPLLCAALLQLVGASPPPVEPAAGAEAEAQTSVLPGAAREQYRGTWHVARAARTLHSLPLCQPQEAGAAEAREYRRIVDVLAARMTGWHAQFSGQPVWAHFFNKTSFIHEMEEVLLPLRVLMAMGDLGRTARQPALAAAPVPAPDTEPAAAAAEAQDEGLTVIDLCAGKGFLPMCLAHGVLAEGPGIARVLLLEKARVNWAHLRDTGTWAGAPEVEIWGPPEEKLNIFDEALVGRLALIPGRLLLVGIHLCRRLSSRAIEIFNLLGPAKTAGLILAPCCLPLASGTIEISAPALGPAGLFSAAAPHLDIRADLNTPHDQVVLHCWNCGGVGHMKEDCPDAPSGLTKGQVRHVLLSEL